MLALEGDLGVVTQMVATGFKQISSGCQTLNRSIARTAAEMVLMLNLTERQFKETHKVLNNHHLALYYLSKGITTLIPLMRKYRQAVTNDRLMIKGFLDGLDELSTGRLCYEVLDPIMLSKYLRTIATDLDRSHSQYTLAFQHTYQYYAEPLISFTNSPDYLPIFLVYKHQLPMTLFSTETVPVPYDAETYLGLRQQYTEVQLNATYFAVATDQYTLLSCKQLDLCIKLRMIYYCEQAYLLKSKEIPSCQAAIYFDLPPEQKVSSCSFVYTQNKAYGPQIIDTGTQFILSNLPQLWILVCETSQRPFTIPYSDFVTYFAYNHAIIDVLNASFHVDLPAQLQDSLDKLTEDIPQYNLLDLQWFQTIENQMLNIYDLGTAVVQVDLIDMMHDVTTDTKKLMYQSNEEFLMAQ